jgi:hypothetical protein
VSITVTFSRPAVVSPLQVPGAGEILEVDIRARRVGRDQEVLAVAADEGLTVDRDEQRADVVESSWRTVRVTP